MIIYIKHERFTITSILEVGRRSRSHLLIRQA